MKRYLTKFNTHLTNAPRGRKILYGLTALVAIMAISVVLALVVYKNDQPKVTIYGEEQPKVAEIKITASGFEPSTLMIKKGTKVIWTNTDQAMHQIASNPYPGNTDLPDLKSEILNNNQTYEYKADKTGTFGYHDMLNPTINGTIEAN